MNLSNGGKKRKLSKSDAKKLKKAVNNKTGCSQRKLARKFKVSQATVSREIKNQNVEYFKRKCAPAATEEQKERQKVRLRKLCRGVFRPTGNAKIIMDDESYFTLDGAGMPGNSGYYTSDRNSCPDNVKHKNQSRQINKMFFYNHVRFH